MFGWASESLHQPFTFYCLWAVVLAGLAYTFKEKRLLMYFVVTALYLFIFNMMHETIREIDPLKLYRYLIWSGGEFVMLIGLFYLAYVKGVVDKFIAKCFAPLACLCIFAMLYRLVDRHIFDVPNSYGVITTIPELTNFLRLLLGTSALFVSLTLKKRKL